MKKGIITVLCIAIVSITMFFVYCNKKPQIIIPRPETKLAEMIGKSFQKNPENWETDVTYANTHEYYIFLNKKCKISVNYSVLKSQDSTLYSEGYINTIRMLNDYEKENLKKILIYGVEYKNNDDITYLSNKDIAYINYQYTSYIIPYLKRQEKIKEVQEQKEKLIKDRLEAKIQDSLRTIMFNKLNSEHCL